MQVFDGQKYALPEMCIDPVYDPVSSHYIYESSMNELMIIYNKFIGNPVGFKVKFSSDKPESMRTISFESIIICTNINKINFPIYD